MSAKYHQNHLLVLFCNHFTISLQGIKTPAKTHDSGETRKQEQNEITCLIQLRPEHHHFQPIRTFGEANRSAFRNETYQWVSSAIIDHQRHFRRVAALGWSIAQNGITNLPRTLHIPGREILELLLCHQHDTWNFSFCDFGQTTTQSSSYLMFQNQREIWLLWKSCRIIPDFVRQNCLKTKVAMGTLPHCSARPCATLARGAQHPRVYWGLGYTSISSCFPRCGTSSSTLPHQLQSHLQGFASSSFLPFSPAPGAGPDTHKASGEQITLISWTLQSYVTALQWFTGKRQSEASSLGVNFIICLSIRLLKIAP